ncbi:MAG: haloacid dehalogenase [Pyrinomonadaceae bacterium]|jgi:Cof subfamily protein (haloacid dehalogenase superfamily)|nr:MAG: haloacid dehalogenase [Pyrinomonadaceae bacterium]
MIKLLALDLDGTLLSSSGKLSETNKQAIRKAEESGVLVTICTGRRFRDAVPVALELQLTAPIISHNGALIKFAETLEILSASTINPTVAKTVLQIGRELGFDPMVSVDPHGKGTLFYERISEENLPLLAYINWARKLHGEEAEEAVHYVPNLDYVLDESEVVHISFSGACERMQEFQEVLESEMNSQVNVLATVYPKQNFTLIDVLPPDTSKGAGVEKLAKFYGFSSSEVMAVGDNLNDLEMLEFAGISVVVANASSELLFNEKYHKTLSNDENGVALAIEKFIFQNGKDSGY